MDSKWLRMDLTLAGRSRHRNDPEFELKDFFDGSRLKLRIDTDTVEGLQVELERNVEVENYEHCSYLRDRIRQLEAEGH